MSKGKTIGWIIIGLIAIVVFLVIFAGTCSVNDIPDPHHPLHFLNSGCKQVGWIIPNHS